MDLLQSVRKEGSRGGRTDFKWEDVKADQHRENYLGHSLMAPVGRWQKNKDLNWYAKDDSGKSAADARAEEIRRIKEAEEDAMAAVLGLPVKERNNPNMAPLGSIASEIDVKNAIAEATAGDDVEVGKGVGFGGYSARAGAGGVEADVLSGDRRGKSGPPDRRGRHDERRAERTARPVTDGDGDRQRRRRSRSRSRHRDRDSRRRHKSRSRSRDRERRRSRSRDRPRDGERHHRHSRDERSRSGDRMERRRRYRSRSPYERSDARRRR